MKPALQNHVTQPGHSPEQDHRGPIKKAMRLRAVVQLAAFVAVVFGGGTFIGLLTLPGDWYSGLDKPWFNPPAWIFGPVWSALYIAIAVAGWRCWQRDRSGWVMKIWGIQLLANFAWSPLFFVAHRIDLALALILFLLVLIAAFIVLNWHRERVAALLFVPYAVWVTFATSLNAALFVLNVPASD